MFRVSTFLYPASRRLFFSQRSSKIKLYAPAESTLISLNLFSRTRLNSSGTGASRGRIFCLKDLKDEWVRRLKEQDVPEAELSFRYIVEHVLSKNGRNIKYVDEVSNYYGSVSCTEVADINQLCQKRLQRMPTQYVIEEWDFRYLTLTLRPPVLIPRPETEELVGLVTSHHLDERSSFEDEFSFLEVGCGSGAICLSLLSENPQTSCVAVDLSPDAIELTAHNARRCGLQDRITLHCIDVVNIQEINHPLKYEALISNPPYIPERDMEELEEEVVRYEDRVALCGGADGMDVIKMILQQAKHLLKPRGMVWLEVDLSHPPSVEKWIRSHPELELEYVTSHKDFTGRERFCQIIYRGELD